MTTEPDDALPIPGLDQPTGRAVSDLERAIRRTIADLAEKGMVAEADAGKAQLAIELAQVIAMKKTTRRASTIGNDARVLMEILDSFADEDSEVDEDLRAAMEAWSEFVAGPQDRSP